MQRMQEMVAEFDELLAKEIAKVAEVDKKVKDLEELEINSPIELLVRKEGGEKTITTNSFLRVSSTIK